ncbi:MAG: 7TM-DISM domain-containing protein [Myxococcota bacterium]|nr:7TM-DISM domain-containing protein [Myxococcota bacterium]
MLNKLIILLFLTLLPRTLFSAEPVIINEALQQADIGTYLEYLKDPNKSLSIEDVAGSSKNNQLIWKQSDKVNLTFGYQKAAYWVRFFVNNPTAKPIEVYLQEAEPKIDYIDLYIPEPSGSFNKISTGDMYPFSQRPINYKFFVFPITIAPKITQTIYLRFETQCPMRILLSLMSPEAFQDKKDRETPLLWILYGILFVMVVYNFFIFLVVREQSYFYYIFYIAAFTLYSMGMEGLAFQYLWPNAHWWANYSILFFLGFFVCMLFQFARHFVQSWRVTRIGDTTGRIMAGIALLVSILPMIINNYRLGAIIEVGVLASMIIPMTLMLLYNITIRRERLKRIPNFHPRYFTILFASLLFFFAGTFLESLRSYGAVPTTVLISKGPLIGAVIQVVLLSFGLADRINIMKNALQELNENLEEKVQTRTKELKEARDSLWGEMALAKKIQTVLLPPKPQIPGYDIAAYMMPADEVGGDYYDIINAGDKDWIVIGDVSGHGVSAGLVMMMAQTSINTALAQTPDLSPSELLMVINNAIRKNIKLMQESKYMTLTAFAAHEGGSLYFAGLHQDVLVYRAQSQSVEIIETDGMWLGVVDDMQGMLDDHSLQLNVNDAILLFTDGITEAQKKDSPIDSESKMREVFGSKRLQRTFQLVATSAVEQIKGKILAALNDYESDDDITMVVVKRVA